MLTEKFSDEKILENFLFSEIQSAELYREIINFIGSYEIRRGEFEGNEYIIKKLDRNNFLLYPEYGGDNGTELFVPYAMAVCKDELLKAVADRAKLNGII